MAKSSRPLETLVQAIRETLEETQEEGHTLAIAQWSEADADAGYLIHTDGRMVGLGEYQYGFGHIDELLSTELDDEVRGWARSEAGHIAGNLETVDLDDESDPFDLLERLPIAFQADSDLVEKCVSDGSVTIAQLFELLSGVKGQLIQEGRSDGTDEIKVTQDVVATRLKQADNGELSWESQVVIAAGGTAQGNAFGERACVSVAGGHLYLPEGAFVAPERKPRHCARHP